jgi:predicted restriction endonuclease
MDDLNLPQAEILRGYRHPYDPTGAIGAVAELLATARVSKAQLEATLRAHQITDTAELKEDFLDVLLHYVRECLADHRLSLDEISAIRTLRRLFRIEEEDLYQDRKDRLRLLLTLEMEWLLKDLRIDPEEALYKAQLQEALGLSYDQFLELTKGPTSDVVEGLFARAALNHGSTDEQKNTLLRDLMALDTVLNLTYQQRRQLYDEIAPAPPNRSIDPDVRREVWKRHGGRCAVCATQAFLEFDHIVPFSMGGSSTARNVQLLCQDCNRKKGAAV